MTPVLSRDLSETAFPGSARRVWSAPAVISHALVVLTPGRLELVPVGSEYTIETLSDVASGVEPELALGPEAIVIELATVNRIRLELEVNAVAIESSEAGPVTLVFTASETADDVYTRLWRRLGPAVELRPFRPDFWTAAREPLGVMAGVLVATLMLALSADAAADLGAGSDAWARLATRLDWRWVCGLGGAALALAQVWLYRRLTCPPARLELVRR